MDLYRNAQETEAAALTLLNAGHYRQCVYFSCLAVELYLKSKLHLVEHHIDLESSHNIIGLYDTLSSRFKSKTNMRPMMVRCRKYFNESRYPYESDISAYTQTFAKEFTDFLANVRNYIDNECIATMEDLQEKYPGSTDLNLR